MTELMTQGPVQVPSPMYCVVDVVVLFIYRLAYTQVGFVVYEDFMTYSSGASDSDLFAGTVVLCTAGGIGFPVSVSVPAYSQACTSI